MEKLKILLESIKNFFGLVESHETFIQNCIKEAKKPCNSLINQSILYRAVCTKETFKNSGFENLSGFQESLVELIFSSLQEEFNNLVEIRDKIESANEKLHDQQKTIEHLYIDLRECRLLDYSKLNPCSPSLEHIITWCCDVWRYYHSFYLQVLQALINIQYEDEQTVNVLLQSFKEDLETKKVINKIRSFGLSTFEFIL